MKNFSKIKKAVATLLIGLLILTFSIASQSIHPLTKTYQTQPSSTPASSPSSMKEYIHPSNTFSLMVPSDWKTTENTGYVLFSAADGNAHVEIFAENTVNALTNDQFSKTIDALETNVFSVNKNYKETKREIQSDKGYAIISKTFDVNKVPFQCSTIYEIKEKGLYVESYYSAVSAVDKMGPLFTQMDTSFKSNPAYLTDLDPFTSGPATYTDSDNLFSILVPAIWTPKYQNGGAVVTFASPDDNAYVILVKENEGKTVTRGMADKRTLELLKKFSSDVRIDKTTVLENGSILMSWAPKSGGLQAATIYKWSGKMWFALTWMVNSGFEKIYSPAFNQSMDSYTLPE